MNRQSNHLLKFLRIRPHETRMVALGLGLAFVSLLGAALGANGIEALFYARVGVDSLPVLYMLLGPLMMLISFGVTALLGRVRRERLFPGLFLILAAGLTLGRLALEGAEAWIYPLLWLLMNTAWILQEQATWGLAGMVTDSRQAKRLFPLIAAGGILGVVAGGTATRLLAPLLGAENLIWGWVLAQLSAYGLANRLSLLSHESIPAHRQEPAKARHDVLQGFQIIRNTPLLRWLAPAMVMSSVLFYALYFIFSQAASQRFAAETTLAGFLGLFQGLTTAMALLISLFLANRLTGRFGVMNILLLTSLIYLGGFSILSLTGGFGLIVGFRFVQMAWRQGISSSAYQAMFSIVPPAHRDQAREFMAGVPGQLGTVLAGVILLAARSTLSQQGLYLLGSGAAFLASVAILQAGRAYGQALLQALRAGQPQLFYQEDEPFLGWQRDGEAMRVAVSGLSHEDPVVRITSAEVLGNLALPQASQALLEAIDDPHPGVRAGVLRAIGRAGAADALLDVALRLQDPMPDVRLAATSVLRDLARHTYGLGAYLRPLLDDPEPEVQAQVAVTLAGMGPDLAQEAFDHLSRLALDEVPAARKAALKALGHSGLKAGFELAEQGLQDALPDVRREAVTALARINPQRSLDLLLGSVRDRDPRVSRAAALALGEVGAPALEKVLQLLDVLDLEHLALIALERLPVHQASERIKIFARRTAVRAQHLYALWWSLVQIEPQDETMEMLCASLRSKAERRAIHALQADGLLGETRAVTLAVEGLRSGNQDQIANALETLEAYLSAEVARPVLPIWDGGEPEIELAQKPFVSLLDDPDPWLRACSALALRRRPESGLEPILQRLASGDPDALVRETAAIALRQEHAMETLATLPVMERILFLRRVRLFANLAPEDIKQVASIAGERYYEPGEILAQQGETGDELYIIVSGSVRVTVETEAQEQVEVARRGVGEYVGEMAILSHERRMASLIAQDALRVLCIGQQAFEGLLRERPETSLAVVRVLCDRLREKDLSMMKNHEHPVGDPGDETLRRILRSAKRIAVVGLSNNPSRASNDVAAYLQRHGYTILPVNPRYERILGEQAYSNLQETPGPIDLVLIFRRSEDVPPHVDEAIEAGAQAVWMQLGIFHKEAAEKAHQAGLEVVMDRCAKIEHRRLLAGWDEA